MTAGPLTPLSRTAVHAAAGPDGLADAADGHTTVGTDARFSPPVGLWCPWCRTPFVGSVDRETGRFAHGECPVAEVDVARLEALARESWFWGRFKERVLGDPAA